METQTQFKASKLQLALIIGVSIYADNLFSDHGKGSLPPIANVYQKDQAKELLGKKQFSITSKTKFDSSHLLKIVEKHLPKKFKSEAKEISKTLIFEARRNQLDPMFLMAVIMTESSFNPEAKGLHGEIGLMQILPKTAEWLAKKHKVTGPINLKNPKTNIRLGAIYLGTLRAKFSKVGNRYIAAYNMGPKNVRRLVASNIEPRIYSDKVLRHYSNMYSQIQKKATVQRGTKIAAL